MPGKNAEKSPTNAVLSASSHLGMISSEFRGRARGGGAPPPPPPFASQNSKALMALVSNIVIFLFIPSASRPPMEMESGSANHGRW